MNRIGIVFKVEKLSRVVIAKGTGLTTIFSLKTVPNLFLPICGVSSLSFDTSSSVPKFLGLFAEIELFRLLEKSDLINIQGET